MMRHQTNCFGALVAILLLLTGASPAWAAPTTEVIQGEYLRIVSVADWQAATNMTPGDAVHWDLEISADAPDPGRVTIGVSATGDAPLTMDAYLCDQSWEAAGCPSGARTLRVDWDVQRNGNRVRLTDMADTDVAHLRCSFSLGSSALADEARTDVRIHVNGAGETVTVGPDDPLAPTGLQSGIPWALAAGALVLLVVGLVLYLRRTRDDGER